MTKKLKLPRKRKKRYMKSLGRNNYHGMRKHFLPGEGETKFPKDIPMTFGDRGIEFVVVSYW